MIIIENIKNGLNTLKKLRQEYKKLPSSSYVEVKKAVELLALAGILHPVTHTDANGLP